jgi:hypothetical protein
MITKMLKLAIIMMFMVPLLSTADTRMNWQAIKTAQSKQLNIGHGAFISKQNDSLLISSGFIQKGELKAPFIAEQLILNSHQENRLLIVTGNNVLSTELTALQGNRAFAAAVDFKDATLVIAGIARQKSTNLVNLVNWHSSSESVASYSLPPLPKAAKSPSAVIIDNTVYVLTGSDADNQFYALDLSPLVNTENQLMLDTSTFEYYKTKNQWMKLPALPLARPNRPYQNAIQLAVQNDGSGKKIFAIGGYQFSEGYLSNQGEVSALTNHWKFDPSAVDLKQSWQELGSITLAKEAFTQRINRLSVLGQSHILAFTNQGNTLSYNAITKSWTQYLAGNHTTGEVSDTSHFISEGISTSAGKIFSLNRATGDKTSLHLWQVNPVQPNKNFGWVNMTVLVIYLLGVVLVGLFFMFKNKSTDDYFRGGQSIPWWAAACSIYATMLSSLTYVALPAMVYQTNWLVLIGIWMIIVVAPVAVYVAMPFFRQINATSAYEYLSKRFNLSVRLFASGLFTLFHISRMGIVMALTALALSAVTPLSASDSVLIMGILCLI